MKKSIYSLLLTLCAVLTSLTASAQRIDTGVDNTNWKPEYTIDFAVGFDPKASEYALARETSLQVFAEKVVEKMNGVMRNSHITVADFDEGISTDALKPCVITVTQSAAGGTGVTPGTGATVRAESITVPAEISIPVGYSYQIKAVVNPSNASNKSLIWESLDEDIATVSSTGVVTGKKIGEMGVFVRSADNEWANAMITVQVTAKGTEPIVPDPGTDPDPGTEGGDNGDKDPNPGTGTGSTTDGLTYTVRLDYSGEQLYLTTNEVKDNSNMTYSLSTAPEEFYVVSTEKGFTLQSATTKKYVGYTGATGWDCYNVADVWTIASIEGASTTILKNDKAGLGVDKAEDKAGVFTNKPDKSAPNIVYRWIIEPVKGTGPETPDLTPCATPVISLEGGSLSVSCATPGADVTYTLDFPALNLQGLGVPNLAGVLASQFCTITASAKAAGYLDSKAATRTFTLAELQPLLVDLSDVNADGRYSIADVARLIDLLRKQK